MAPKRAKPSKKRKRKNAAEGDGVDDLSDLPPTFIEDVKELISALEETDDDTLDLITEIRRAFKRRLHLEAVGKDDITEFLASYDNEFASLEILAVRLFRQQRKADRFLELLDEAGKGFLVVEDLKRVSEEILGPETTEEHLMEMFQEFDRSGDGVLFRKDVILLARSIGL